MAILTQVQIENGYFNEIVMFEHIRELKDYIGQDEISISCTQLDYHVDSERERKRILNEWIDFLKLNPKAFKKLQFTSHVPQRLFDAACCQTDLEVLRFKWGNYKDLSALSRLENLKFLYIGSGAGVESLMPLTELKSLIVLTVENFKRIEDYSPLAALDNLEQLEICGPILRNTPIKDVDFLRDMPNLLSFWCPNTTIRKKYSEAEREESLAAVPNLHFKWGCLPF